MITKKKLFAALLISAILLVPAKVTASTPTSHWGHSPSNTEAINIAVIRINFTDNLSSPGSATLIGDLLFNEPDIDKKRMSLAFFYQTASYGRVQVTGSVFPTITIVRTSRDCDDYKTWGRTAREALESQGTNLDEYTHMMYFWPPQGCYYAGIAELPGDEIGMNLWRRWWRTTDGQGDAMDTMIHELGHNLGAPHSGAIRCRAGGVSVAGITEKCRAPWAFGRFGGSDTWEYGDNLDVMGGNLYLPFHALPSSASRFMMGFLAEEEMPLIEAAGTYEIELNPLNEPNAAIKGYRIRRPNVEAYGLWGMSTHKTAPEICLDWRERGTLFDRFPSSISRGISIRLCDVTGTQQRGAHGNAVLVDATPGSRSGFRDWLDGPLRVGKSFIDEVSGIRIKLLSIQRDPINNALSRARLRIEIP